MEERKEKEKGKASEDRKTGKVEAKTVGRGIRGLLGLGQEWCLTKMDFCKQLHFNTSDGLFDLHII